MHPLLPQVSVREYCKKVGIVVEAYSPMARALPQLLNNEVLQEIATRTGGTKAGVVMGWFIKKGVVAIPKSANEGRMRENLNVRTDYPLL